MCCAQARSRIVVSVVIIEDETLYRFRRLAIIDLSFGIRTIAPTEGGSTADTGWIGHMHEHAAEERETVEHGVAGRPPNWSPRQSCRRPQS